jgi:hypothetical protein
MGNIMRVEGEILSGVSDLRYTPLDKLARTTESLAGDSLRHVLLADAGNRVSVAAFGSCI